MDEKIDQLWAEYQVSPFRWIEDALSLTPQVPKPEAHEKVTRLFTCPADKFNEYAGELRLNDFEPFQTGKEITWQQAIAVIAIQRMLAKTLPMRIAIRSARGTGKSALTSILLFYWLCVHPESKAMATSPSAAQLSDALWSEVSKTHRKLKQEFQDMFEVSSTYIRLKESPKEIFATARTASKENPSALSGIHAVYLLAIGEEAAEIPEEVYVPARGTLTQEFNILYLISQPLSLEGTFYEAFHAEQDRWVLLHFDGLESPIFDMGLELDFREKYGADSYEYRTTIRGDFPDAKVEYSNWYRFFPDEWIEKVLVDDPNLLPPWAGKEYLGVDVAGSGGDETVGFLRAGRVGRVAFIQATSDKVSVSGAIHMVLQERLRLNPFDVGIDAFGTGHDVSQQVLFDSGTTQAVVTPVNVGDQVREEDLRERYMNLRAACYDALRIWGNMGGRIVMHPKLKEQLKSIMATRSGKRLKIMSKVEMKKNKKPSPDLVDGATLSFVTSYQFAIDGRIDTMNQVPLVTRSKQAFDKSSMIPW